MIVGDQIYDTMSDDGYQSELEDLVRELGLSKIIQFIGFRKDWSSSGVLKLDIYNPSQKIVEGSLVIVDKNTSMQGLDKKSLGDYGDRLDTKVIIKPGQNTVEIELSGVTTNNRARALDLKNIIKFAFDFQLDEFYVDNICLQKSEE